MHLRIDRPELARRSFLVSTVLAVLTTKSAFADEAPQGGQWIELSVGHAFVMQAPPDSRFVPAAGTDSFVGEIRGPGFSLQMDFGRYSNPLSDSGSMREVQSVETRIDGRTARIVSGILATPAAGGRFFTGLHVPEVASTAIGPVKLTLSGAVRRERTHAVLLRMFSTIRFKLRP